MASTPEQVDKVEVLFGLPEAGWIDLTISTATQKISWPLSHVRSPFVSGFTDWLEAIADRGHGILIIDTEGNLPEVHVTPAGGDAIKVVGESIYDNKPDFEIEISRYRFVHDFYSSLVAYSKSDELRKNWHEWFTDLHDPDWRMDFPPEVQQRLEKPWLIRSQNVERFLQRDTWLKRLSAWFAA